jgi:hypothetical protein
MTHKSRKIKKFHCSAERSFLRAEGFFCNLEVLYGGLKKVQFFSAVKLGYVSIFDHQNPGSGSVFSLKCWIRILPPPTPTPPPVTPTTDPNVTGTVPNRVGCIIINKIVLLRHRVELE